MTEESGARIRPLPLDVVGKIAAGEVVQRPVNVVKELMENSLDAGAKKIAVKVAQGGLKSITVTDDGKGIPKADLPLLCERHATSKLCDFEDLMKLVSYGFRGEALASVSMVADVSVLTKTSQSPCAYKAEYRNGKLTSTPRPTAGLEGTTIRVSGLFPGRPLKAISTKVSLGRTQKNR